MQELRSEIAGVWKPLIICPNAPMAQRIGSALSKRGIPDVGLMSQYPPVGSIASVAARQRSDICFLDVASNPDKALVLIAEAAPSMPVVALNPGNDADLILKCLRQGACDFLPDASDDQISAVLERLARQHARLEPAKTSSVYCVIPGKAGCGASTLATYLAIDLKHSGSKVLLVDTDRVTASIAFLLKLRSDFHVGDALRDWQRMDKDLWGRLVVPCHGIDVLLAPEDPTIAVGADPQSAFELFRFWRQQYQAIVVDHPGASSSFDLAGAADEVLLVTTNDLAALHDTRRTLECMEKGAVDRVKVKLVVSRYRVSAGLKREDVKAALKMEPYATLNEDFQSVQAALLDGRPIAHDSNFGRGVRALMEQLTGKEKAAKKRSSLFSFLPHR